jgi:hypothetical protein
MSISNLSVYVSRFSSWAPGLESPEDWREWAKGNRNINSSAESPSLDIGESPFLYMNRKEFSLFKRRLSQISRMTVQVLHDIMPITEENVKTIFISFRGEITQQFKINRMLAVEGGISPAAFSHSVFNTPVAAAAMVLGLTSGYCAAYPEKNHFDSGFLAAVSPILSGNANKTLLVYADELCPSGYGELCPVPNEPLSFAAVISADESGIPLTAEALKTPVDFLKFLYSRRADN